MPKVGWNQFSWRFRQSIQYPEFRLPAFMLPSHQCRYLMEKVRVAVANGGIVGLAQPVSGSIADTTKLHLSLNGFSSFGSFIQNSVYSSRILFLLRRRRRVLGYLICKVVFVRVHGQNYLSPRSTHAAPLLHNSSTLPAGSFVTFIGSGGMSRLGETFKAEQRR